MATQSTFKTVNVLGFAGNEGVGTTFNVTITFAQLISLFEVHQCESDDERLQRELTKSRHKNITDYLVNRDDTIFPQLTAFFTNQVKVKPVSITGAKLASLTLSSDAERMLVDGQGRLVGTDGALAARPELATRTVDIKIILANGPTLLEDASRIRQVFTDYHKNVVKTNSSINLFFDSSEMSSRFVVDALEALEKANCTLSQHVARDGRTTHIYTLAQFKTFLRVFMAKTDSQINAEFQDEQLRTMWLSLIVDFARQIESLFPVFSDASSGRITNKEAKEDSILCCAIGLEALGRVGNLVIDNSIKSSVKPDFTILEPLVEMDMSRVAPHWQGKVMIDKKIIKGSARTLAMKLAVKAQLQMTEEFMGIAA